nr:hypothetical protein [Tanacetum cinerariifolium]
MANSVFIFRCACFNGHAVYHQNPTKGGSYPRIISSQKKCLRCKRYYQDKDNSPTACSFHGHANGDKGLLALAPPHQGIDGEWSDGSGVIVYKWNDKTDRPNTGRSNWKKRWSCCAEYGENAPPCRQVNFEVPIHMA